MNIRPIRNEDDYQLALKAVSHYFDHPPEVGTPKAMSSTYSSP